MGITISGGLNIGSGLTMPAIPASLSDPYFENVTLLLPGNGSNNSTNNTFTDSSTNNFAITRNGNTTQGTFSPFSQTGWSNYFDGSGDYLSVSSTPLPTTGDFTFECWVYIISYSTMVTIIGNQSLSNRYLLFVPSDGAAYIQVGPTFSAQAPANTILTNRWYHIATTRVGTTHSMFVNGQPISLTVGGTSPSSLDNSTFYIGGNYNSSYIMNGYISNFRVVNSILYTSSFTPSTVPLSNVANTSILTCQSNRFIDNSTNAFTITPNGDVSVQAFSPFAPAAAWSAATYGGSGYFDGTGDYLVTSTNAAFAMSSGDFTVEAWVNVRSTTGYRYIFDFRDGSGAATNIYAYLNSGTMNLNVGVGTTDDSASGSITLGAWAHVALVRSGSTITVYINGVSTNSFSSSQNFSTSTAVTIGRRYTIEQYFIGYISNLHIVKGTAVYTANFTPPTSPDTAISNTSLLLNFTNAGIYDATGKNNLETVGNAQISTTQSKWGDSSIYSNGGYLRSSASNLYNFGSGDFTVEMYIYLNSFSSFLGTFCGVWGTTTPYREWIIRQGNSPSPSKLRFVTGNGSTTTTFETSSSVLVTNQWMHIAACRASGTLRLYVDGIEVLSGADSNNIPITGTPLTVFSISDGTITSNGYLQDLRITKGYARYTANFTPPTAPLPTY